MFEYTNEPEYFMSEDNYMVVHRSNWPAVEAELSDRLQQVCLLPMLVPHAAFAVMQVVGFLSDAGWTVLKAPRKDKRPDFGDQWEVVSPEGEMVHIWLDTADTYDPVQAGMTGQAEQQPND